MKGIEKLFKNNIFVAIMAIFCCALWGSASPFIKTGYALMLTNTNYASTILFAGVRFFLSGIIVIAIYSLVRRKFLYPKRKNLKKVACVSLFQTIIQYMFFYVGLANTTGVKGTVISSSGTFFAILFASLIFRQEKLTPKKLFASLIGFLGILIINLDGLDFNIKLTGELFVIFSSMSYGISSALIKKTSEYEDPVIVSGYQFAFGGLVMILAGLLFGGKITIDSVSATLVLLHLALLSAIAYSVWGVLLKYNSVSKVAIYMFTMPIFGVILSKMMLSEQGGVSIDKLLVSLVLVSVGILIINYKKIGE